MKCFFGFSVGLLLGLAATDAIAADAPKLERELIKDNLFRRGFILWQPKPGQHVPYGQLEGFDKKAEPIWGLAQWSSKFPLDPNWVTSGAEGALLCSNSAKSIRVGRTGTPHADLSLAVNTAVEYGAKARQAGNPWVHLLVEQQFDPPARLQELSAARLHVEGRLLRSRNLHQNDYSEKIHAAQFQIFFTVQNRNRQSAGNGDLLWFGVPIYDNRQRFPKAFAAQDFGGTAKFIFTPKAKTFVADSAHDGNWIVIDKDLLPLMRDALEAAWARGFLLASKEFGDYYIGGMNMGWELPGTFDVEMQVRNLSLKLSEK